MGGGEVVPVADNDLEAAYGIGKRQEGNIGKRIKNEDRYTEEKQDKGVKEKVEGYGFENPQTNSRECFGGEAVDEKKEKDKKRKNAEKERNKDKEPEKDKGKKYKGVVDKNDQKDKEKNAKEKKDKKPYDIYRDTHGKEDEGKELKENKVKKEEKKKNTNKNKKKDEEKTDKEDNYITEKLKKKLIKLDAKLEKILAKKEDYLQKLKEVEGKPAQDFIAVANYDSVIASKLDTGSLERGMRLMNVSGSTREESIEMNKGKNIMEDADVKNKDDNYKKGKDVKDEREKEVSYMHEVKSCKSRGIMEETEAREWKHKKDERRKEKKGKNKAKFSVQKSSKKLAELYDKLGHVLSETKDYLQSLKEAEMSSQQDADTRPQCQPLNDHKSKDKDMEILVKETNSLSVSRSTHDGKDESNAFDKGCTSQDGWIAYPKLDEKDICGVGY